MTKTDLVILSSLGLVLEQEYGFDIREITPADKAEKLAKLVATNCPEFLDEEYDDKEDFLKAYMELLEKL